MLSLVLSLAVSTALAQTGSLIDTHIDLWYNGSPSMGVPLLSCAQWKDPQHKNPAPLMTFDKAKIDFGDCINEFRSWGKFYCDSPGTLRWDKYNAAGCSGQPTVTTYPVFGGCIPGNPLTVSTVFSWKGDCLPVKGATTPAPIATVVEHPHPHVVSPPVCKKGGSLGDCRGPQMHCAKAVAQPPTLEKMRWCMYDLVDCGSNDKKLIPTDCCKTYILATRPASDQPWNNLVAQEQAANGWSTPTIAEAQVIHKRCSALGFTPTPVMQTTPTPTSMWNPLPKCASYSVSACINDGVQFYCANEALARGVQPNPTTMRQCVYDIVDCKHAPNGVVSSQCCDAHVIATRRTADPGWAPLIAKFAADNGVSNAQAEADFIQLGCNTIGLKTPSPVPGTSPATPKPVAAPGKKDPCSGKKKSACVKMTKDCVFDNKRGGCVNINLTPAPVALANPCAKFDGKEKQCNNQKACMYYPGNKCDAATPTAAPTLASLPFWKATCQSYKGTGNDEAACKAFTFVALPDKKGNAKTLKGCEWNKKLKRCQGKKIGCKALGLYKKDLCDSYNSIGCKSTFKTSKKTGNSKFKKCGGKGIQ